MLRKLPGQRHRFRGLSLADLGMPIVPGLVPAFEAQVKIPADGLWNHPMPYIEVTEPGDNARMRPRNGLSAQQQHPLDAELGRVVREIRGNSEVASRHGAFCRLTIHLGKAEEPPRFRSGQFRLGHGVDLLPTGNGISDEEGMRVAELVQAVDQRFHADLRLHAGTQGGVGACEGHSLKVIGGQDQEIHIALRCGLATRHAAKDNQFGDPLFHPIPEEDAAEVLHSSQVPVLIHFEFRRGTRSKGAIEFLRGRVDPVEHGGQDALDIAELAG